LAAKLPPSTPAATPPVAPPATPPVALSVPLSREDKDAGFKGAMEEGLSLQKDSRHQDAVAAFSRAVQLKPDSAPAHANLGLALGGLKEFESAIRELSEAIRIAPKNGELFLYRAGVNREWNKTSAAIADYTAAIRYAPTSAAFNARGLYYSATRQLTLALKDFNSAIRLDPENAELYRNRASVRAESGDTAGGEADLQMARSRGWPEAAFTKEAVKK
jgi:tetratricopeptide (TPR) repeat protein